MLIFGNLGRNNPFWAQIKKSFEVSLKMLNCGQKYQNWNLSVKNYICEKNSRNGAVQVNIIKFGAYGGEHPDSMLFLSIMSDSGQKIRNCRVQVKLPRSGGWGDSRNRVDKIKKAPLREYPEIREFRWKCPL